MAARNITPSTLCFWHRSGVPAWVREEFKGPRCWLCKDKPDTVRTVAEIVAENKRRAFRFGSACKGKQKEIVIR